MNLKSILLTTAAISLIGSHVFGANVNYYSYLQTETVRLETLCGVTRMVPVRQPGEAPEVSMAYSPEPSDYYLLENRIRELKQMNCQAQPAQEILRRERIIQVPQNKILKLAKTYQALGWKTQISFFENGSCDGNVAESLILDADPGVFFCITATETK